MFLRCIHNLTYTESDSSVTFPTAINFIDFSLPVKSVTGSKSGPTMIAEFFESIKFRKNTAKTMSLSLIDSTIQKAQQLDKAFESTIEDFIASDEGYVTLENYLIAAKQQNIIAGNIIYCKELNSVKQLIHKYKCAIVETYLVSSFLSNSAKGQSTINSIGQDTALASDYTKAFIAFGYDSQGLIVMNSLGTKWGSIGFSKISWSALSADVNLPNGEKQRCFIKAAAFKGCFV